MTHTHTHFFLKHATLSALVVGILTVATSTSSYLTADLSGGGVTLNSLQQVPITSEFKPALHGAAIVSTEISAEHAERELMIGMLCILLGFFLHMLYIRKTLETAEHVPVHAGHKHSKIQHVKIWIERSIDTDIHHFPS